MHNPMFIESIQVNFKCAVCGTEKNRIIFLHNTLIEHVNINDLVRECFTCRNLPMDVVNIICKLKENLYGSK